MIGVRDGNVRDGNVATVPLVEQSPER
jgi:hypothetical protein